MRVLIIPVRRQRMYNKDRGGPSSVIFFYLVDLISSFSLLKMYIGHISHFFLRIQSGNGDKEEISVNVKCLHKEMVAVSSTFCFYFVFLVTFLSFPALDHENKSCCLA